METQSSTDVPEKFSNAIVDYVNHSHIHIDVESTYNALSSFLAQPKDKVSIKKIEEVAKVITSFPAYSDVVYLITRTKEKMELTTDTKKKAAFNASIHVLVGYVVSALMGN